MLIQSNCTYNSKKIMINNIGNWKFLGYYIIVSKDQQYHNNSNITCKNNKSKILCIPFHETCDNMIIVV